MRGLCEVPSDPETISQLEVQAIEQDRFPELVKLVVKLGNETADATLSRAL